MKYFEYVYLILMVMALVFLSKEWETLPGQSRIMLCIVTGIFAFMFSFRRTQRIRAEKAWEAELQATEEEADEIEEEI